MRVLEKTDEMFEQIKAITGAAFAGVELPSYEQLRFIYDMGDVFVLEFVGQVVAYAIVTHVGQPFIRSIATHPDWQGRGYGTALLEEIIAHYSDSLVKLGRDFEYIELTVNVNNPAQKLYFDLGWRAIQVIRKHYGEVDGLRMRRIL